MTIDILTIFPEMFESVLNTSILGRAREKGIVTIEATDIRPFSNMKHKNTDDYPFGGGAGMLMTPQPIADAIKAVCRMRGVKGACKSENQDLETEAMNKEPALTEENNFAQENLFAPGESFVDTALRDDADQEIGLFSSAKATYKDAPATARNAADAPESEQREAKHVKRIYLSPRGVPLTQKLAQELAQEENLILLCGHYEGVDQRVLDKYIDMEISVGDYVLTGGEVAAMVLVDCVSRLIPGVLGSEESPQDESFSDAGLLEYPQYTRPRVFEGMEVPPVLLSGDHAKISAWRKEQAFAVTAQRRPDLLK